MSPFPHSVAVTEICVGAENDDIGVGVSMVMGAAVDGVSEVTSFVDDSDMNGQVKLGTRRRVGGHSAGRVRLIADDGDGGGGKGCVEGDGGERWRE